MYRMSYVFCFFILLLSAVSCISDGTKPTAVAASHVGNESAVSEQKQTEEESFETMATRLLSELEQAMSVYDIHKAFALFNTLYKEGIESDSALCITAYEKIRPLLEAISIEPLTEPGPTIAGSPFSQPFSIRIMVTTPEKQFPLAYYPVEIHYPYTENTGNNSVKVETVETDAEGCLHFVPPVPEKAMDGTLYFYLFPTEPGKEVLFADTVTHVRAAFPYKVATADKSISTIITILDYDENNQPVFSHNITATRLLTGLMKRGFRRVGLDEYRELTETEEAPIIHAAQEKIGMTVERFIFGKTYINIENTEDGLFTCTIQADISVWNFKQARKTNRFTFKYAAKAKTKWQAIQDARTNLGESVIAETFIYSL